MRTNRFCFLDGRKELRPARRIEVLDEIPWTLKEQILSHFSATCKHSSIHLRFQVFRASLVDPSSQDLSQNRQYRDTVMCLPTHTQDKVVAVVMVHIIFPRSGSIVVLLSPTHQHEGKTTSDAG